MARRAPLHPLMKCVPHPLSVVSVPLADGGAMPPHVGPLRIFGAIFSFNDVLGFHPCSARVPEGTVFIFAPLMPSPCEGVRLLRSTRRLRRWSATADLSRSSVSSTTCGSLARRAPSCTTKWLQNVGFTPPQWPR